MSDLRERLYSDDEIVELLEKAAAMGLLLDKGSDLRAARDRRT